MSEIIQAKSIPRSQKEYNKIIRRHKQRDFGATRAPEADMDIANIPYSEITKMAEFILQMWTTNQTVTPGKHHCFIGTKVIPRSMFDAGEAFAATITRHAAKNGVDKVEFLKGLLNKDIIEDNKNTANQSDKKSPKLST